jgi:hypothetical protein
MSLFSRRVDGPRKLRRKLDADMRTCRQLAEDYGGVAGERSFDMLGFCARAFELGATTEIEYLISHGVDGTEFFIRELKPNWHDLTREERATKIAAFVRFTNLLEHSDDDTAIAGLPELRATVRTKIVLLACAYDVYHDDDYCRRIARNPQRFGEYDLPITAVHA